MLQRSMEKALLASRTQVLKNRPAENVNKCIELMMDVDPRLFAKLDDEEKQTLKAGLDELTAVIEAFKKQI